MCYKVYPYKQGSKSAKELASALKGRVLRLQGSAYVPADSDPVINWGNQSPLPYILPFLRWNGDINALQSASNKRSFFENMADTSVIPHFWTNRNNIPSDAYPVVCRTLLNSHSGNGIVIANTPEELVNAPLYVEYVKKKDEYRVHLGRCRVFVGGDDHSETDNGWSTSTSIIAVQRKARRTEHENPNWQIRNLANGFVYVRNNVNPPAAVVEAAKIAFSKFNLDFGAVDVIWNDNAKRAFVLEINTAPGLEGQTITDYANFFTGE